MTQTAQKQSTASYKFDPEILREYDIRGTVGKNLTEETAYALGRSFGTFMASKGWKICAVGYDGRASSPALSQNLRQGLKDCGINVINTGRGPTPMLYFATKSMKLDAGIMVTGSHNPPQYNGFKMMTREGSVFGKMIQDLARTTEFVQGVGTEEQKDVSEDYIARLLADLKHKRDFTVVWDNGNGAGGEILQRLVKKLPGTHHVLYGEIDGTFPNHHPDPTVDKNLVDLIAKVKETKADFGIAFDGDADRIGAVDGTGKVIRGDMLLALYSRTVIKENPDAAIIADVKSSDSLFKEIARLGGRPICWNTGHSLVKAKMAETGAKLAGELSGHIFFADKYYGYDDALYAGIRLMDVIAAEDIDLTTVFSHIPPMFSTPELRIEVREEEKFEMVRKMGEALRPQLTQDNQLLDIDGLRITTPDGWWLVRASNTQNVLVARFEAKTEAKLADMQKTLNTLLQPFGYSLDSQADH
ncbi:MAG: phosphomannomutase [Alphaproteobacteria bacterium]|nr:phosphomannomutase [Alphaproteobacteria bacterium]